MMNMYKEIDVAKDIWLSRQLDQYDYILLLPDNDKDFSARIRAAFTARLGSMRGLALDGYEVNALLRLYSLYSFTGKLIIGSFDLPTGRKLRNLLESGVATEDELIHDVILGIM